MAAKRSMRKPKSSLKVKKVALRDLPAKKKGGDVKAGLTSFAPPYTPVAPRG